MSKFIKAIFILASFFSFSVLAEISIIVHPSNAASVSSDDVSRIFLGKKKSFSDGNTVVPINLKEGSDTRETFNSTVLNKNSSQLKAYWSKLVFTGKGAPPKEVASAAEMLKLIANNPNMIGYLDSSAVDASVKVVAKY